MSEVESFITRTGLQAWHKYEAGVSANGLCNDYSGNGRHLVQASTPPVLTSDVINGQPGWLFDGSANPLQATTSFTPKHIFILASATDATFDGYRTLLGGNSGDILTGDVGFARFYDFGYGSNFVYRKNDVLFANASLTAPVSGAFALMEVQSPSGYALAQINVGWDVLATAGRKWKGYFIEDLMYSRVLSDAERHDVYEYIAMKYLLWKQNSSGLNIFPFQPNWGQPLSESKRVLSSSAVSGAYKARSKSTQKKGIQPSFESRIAEEYDTAVAFNDEHYPGSTFIWKDDGFSPARETEMRFLSDVQMTRSEDFNDKEYNFQAIEV